MELVADKRMRVTMFLCDYAQVSPEGKVTAVGAFWTVTGPGPASFCIAGAVEVPWNSTNTGHTFRAECVDLDGNPVLVPTEEGERPLLVEVGFEVGRPAGLRPGTALPVPLAIPIGPVQLPAGGHFEWRLLVDGEAREDWRLPFSTRPPFLQPAA
ncbi:MAG TPA: hypothetical protein VM266_05370 [Solirubrobacteraceae bacterium]|nr:hypothetical protein [Solirubrobacteraceae bacterium]